MVQHDSEQHGDEPHGGAPHEGEPHGGGHERGSGGLARTVQLVASGYLLTVNPVDGSEIEPCPPGELPGRPRKLTLDERPDQGRAATPAGGTPAAPEDIPVVDREEERERLGRLLARGRSVRLTGPPGAGRSTLLDVVAEDVAGLAPDGVIRLSGYRRTPDDVLYELFATVHEAPLHRPAREEVAEALETVGAVVVLDDLEFGGAALDEVLAVTPECAFLLSATPDVAAPSAEAQVEEVRLTGLSRTGSLELLERAALRPLTDEEADWAADLWFETDGLPLRFAQAGALLRQRVRRRITLPGSVRDAEGPGGDASPPQAAGPASGLVPLVAEGLSDAARSALRFAVALDGELPHHTHLPALVGDPQADHAVAELAAAGLVTAAGGHYRLPGDTAGELTAAGYAEEASARAQAAAQHYAWWAGHPSVSSERVGAESDAVLAAVQCARRCGHPSAAVLLARTAAPMLAAALRWSAWERMLRSGQEAARTVGEVAEEAYFHHELGVLALCADNPERARAELEASIGLRGILADQRGTVAGRRALALVSDRLAGGVGVGGAGGVGGVGGAGLAQGRNPAPSGLSQAQSGGFFPAAAGEESASPPGGAPVGGVQGAAYGEGGASDDSVETLVTRAAAHGQATDEPLTLASTGAHGSAAGTATGTGAHGKRRTGWRGLMATGTRRNVVAAGAGALLAAVLGTVVTLASVSGGEDPPADTVKPEQSASQQDDDSDLTADRPGTDDGSTAPGPANRPQEPGPTSGAPSASDSPGSSSPDDESSKPSDSASSSDDGSDDTGGSGDGGGSGGGSGSGGSSGGGSSTGGSSGGGTGGGSSDGGSTDGGSTDGGSTDGGSTDGGSTDGGSTDGGSTDGGSTDGGTTDGGTTTGGSSDGGTSDSASPTSSSTGTSGSASATGSPTV